LGEAGHAPAADRRAVAVCEVLVADAVPLDELLAVGAEVVRVDAEEDDAPAVPLAVRGLEPRRLGLARDAPRRPEVDDDRLAAQRRQRDPRAAVERPQRERRRRRLVAGLDLVDEARRLVLVG